MRTKKRDHPDLQIGGCLGLQHPGLISVLREQERCAKNRLNVSSSHLRTGVPDQPPTIPQTDSKTSDQRGCVYFIEDGGTASIKIGATRNVANRLRQIQTHTPSTLKLLAEIEIDDAFKIERRLHAVFADLRIRGEWFSSGIGWFPDALAEIVDTTEDGQRCPLCVCGDIVVDRDEYATSLLHHIISSTLHERCCAKHSLDA